MRTQGTELYLIDPEGGAVLDVGCVTEINGVSTTVAQNEITCLRDPVRRFAPGLRDAGQMTFGLYTDPQDATHVRMHEIYLSLAEDLRWAIGWSDGIGIPPTSALGSAAEYDFVLPGTRTWNTLIGFIQTFPFTFAQNSEVTSELIVVINDEPLWLPAAS